MNKQVTFLLVVLLLAIIVTSCKTTSTSTTKTHSIYDTIIYEKSEVIQLPANYTFTDKNPCKNDSLVISDQLLEIGKLKLQIINLNGKLVIQVKNDTVKDIKEKEIKKHTEKQVETIETIITKYRTPKFWWWLLGIVLVYISYRLLRIYLPIIRFLPY